MQVYNPKNTQNMKKIYNYLIALLLPTMVSCNGGKVQEEPEDMYGCPIPEPQECEEDSVILLEEPEYAPDYRS